MVELLPGLPDHVAAYKAAGTVTRDEYERVVMHRVDEVAERYGQINFLVLLETSFTKYSLASFLDYLKVSFEHFNRWNRMAIVSDEKLVRVAYDGLHAIVPGTIKTYQLQDYAEAKLWVSAPLETE